METGLLMIFAPPLSLSLYLYRLYHLFCVGNAQFPGN